MRYKYFIFIISFFQNTIKAEIEVFERNLGNDVQIGISETRYKSVKLKCGFDSMNVDLQTDEDFTGVIYTRGSFHKKNAPCFLDPGYERGQRSFTITFPLDKCNTKKEGDTYSNVVVLQYDKELIMPGDAAFILECDLGTPRDITVQANLRSRNAAVSKISLIDADPFEKDKRSKRGVVQNASFTVEITPTSSLSSRSTLPKIDL